MNERIAIWNVLHDGEITAVSEDGDTLTMFVSIPYLRRRLKPLGDSFVLTLGGVRHVEFRDFGSRTDTLRDELEIGTPEIFTLGVQSTLAPNNLQKPYRHMTTPSASSSDLHA